MFIGPSLDLPFWDEVNPFGRDESTQLIVTFRDSRNQFTVFAYFFGR